MGGKHDLVGAARQKKGGARYSDGDPAAVHGMRGINPVLNPVLPWYWRINAFFQNLLLVTAAWVRKHKTDRSQ